MKNGKPTKLETEFLQSVGYIKQAFPIHVPSPDWTRYQVRLFPSTILGWVETDGIRWLAETVSHGEGGFTSRDEAVLALKDWAGIDLPKLDRRRRRAQSKRLD